MSFEWWQLVVSAAVGMCIAAGLVVGVDEWRWLRRTGRLTAAARSEVTMSLSLLPPNIVTSLALGGVWLALYRQAAALAPWQVPVNAPTIALAFVLVELSYYWEHRCAHRVPVLWTAYHAVHHSSPGYTVATAYRVSFLNQFLAPAFYLPWLLLGFDPLLILGLQLLSFHYQAWLHTEMIGSLGRLDRCVNTPAVHRMHHSIEPRHRDRNFGAILLVWDKVFGTFAAPEPLRGYGIPGELPPRTLLGLYFDPWRRARRSARSPSGQSTRR